LHHFHVVDSFEYCEQEGNLLDDQVFLDRTYNVDPVADVVRVLDEQEDAGSKELLRCDREDEGKG
jgi:hypothetical protein